MGLSWASLVLYGDPTQTLVQQLAARSDRRLTIPIPPKPAEPPRGPRARRTVLHGEAPLQAAPSTLLNAVRGPGMRAVDRLRGPADLKVNEEELAVVEKGGIRYWATISNGEPRPLASDMPDIAERSENTLRRERGFADYVKIVARWAAGRVEQGFVKELVQQYDRDVVDTERMLVHDPISYELRTYTNDDDTACSPNPQARGCLLLIHGTFSRSQSPVNGLGRGFFDWAHRNYRHVLAFDHWTLSKAPDENARDLCKLLPRDIAEGQHPLDIITHSRGGLVARALVQLPQLNGNDAARVSGAVKRVVFVGTPNFGTSLADPGNWGRAADLLINLVHVDALGLYGKLSGFLARLVARRAVEAAGDELLNQIPGLLAQNPAPGKSRLLGALRGVEVPTRVRFSAVSTNYEPRRDQAHLKFIVKAAGDAAADAFFKGFNDLVVNSRNVWTDEAPGAVPLVERENLLVITPSDSGFELPEGPVASLYGVHHTNLFETEQTRRFLVDQLRRPVD
jgi:hypothetical protein